MRLFGWLAVAAILLGGCATTCDKSGGNTSGGEPVVSPANVSDKQQVDSSLYLEDTEHWWEVYK